MRRTPPSTSTRACTSCTCPRCTLKAAETLSHTALSVAHVAMHRHHPDAAFVFNAANAPFVPLLHARGVPVAVHVDGLEWQRDKWHGAGRAYYRWAEQSAVRHADALIADAKGIADYYASEFGASTRQIAYGAPVQLKPVSDRLEELGLLWKGYHLVVARFEPENHVDLIVAGLRAVGCASPPRGGRRGAVRRGVHRAGPVGGPRGPARSTARRHVRPGPPRPAVRGRAELCARPLGRRDQPVAAPRDGGRDRRAGVGLPVQSRGRRRARDGTSATPHRSPRSSMRPSGSPTGPCATARPCATSCGRGTAGTTSPSPTSSWRSS